MVLRMQADGPWRAFRFQAPDRDGGAPSGDVVVGEFPDDTPEGEPPAEEPAEPPAEDPDGEPNPDDDAPEPSATPPAKPRSDSVPVGVVKQLREENRAIKQQLAQVLHRVSPKVDPLDAKELATEVLKQFPEGEEGSPEREQYEIAKGLAPVLPKILKAMRKALLPEFETYQAITAGAIPRLHEQQFLLEQIMEALPDQEYAEYDLGDGKVLKIKQAQRPKAFQHLDKIRKHQQARFRESGGTELPSAKDSFAAVLEQVEAEAAASATNEGRIRTDERQRAEREAKARRGASRSAGPGPQAAVPRGKATPGKRTFAQIDASGFDARI